MPENVLITGASRGIGREAALKFAREGYNVIINCHKSEALLCELQREIRSLGVRCMAFVEDVSQFDRVVEIFDCLKAENFLPDIIVNNAGISHIGLLQDMTAMEWQNIINTNLSSVFNVCRMAVPYMVHNKYGRIINISSMWGITGASCETAYSASKGGMNSFTKALAKELAPSNISVNAIAFGVVDTLMNDFLDENERNLLMEEIPAGRFLTSGEAADIIYSVSLLNSYVTGQIITADGGYT